MKDISYFGARRDIYRGSSISGEGRGNFSRYILVREPTRPTFVPAATVAIRIGFMDVESARNLIYWILLRAIDRSDIQSRGKGDVRSSWIPPPSIDVSLRRDKSKYSFVQTRKIRSDAEIYYRL